MTVLPRDSRRREIGGQDALERRLPVPRRTPVGWVLSLFLTRSALGLAPSLTPAVIFLPLGMLLGPQGVDVLSSAVVRQLNLAVTIGLAVLGVMVGVALGREMRTAWRMFLAASLESTVTIVAVTGATAYFASATAVPIGDAFVVLVIAMGLCASASSATSADADSEPAAAVATRVADLDDVVPILCAVVAFALVPRPVALPAWWLAAAPLVIGAGVGAIGWLLFERAESPAERVVFVLGALGFAGGAASYLRVSPLAVGLLAGVIWTLAPGRADRLVEDDLRKVQHPVVVLLLLTAGAMTSISLPAVWLLAPYVLFRLAGKIAGAWLSAPLIDAGVADLAAYLMPPGVLAIAFALNFRQILPEPAGDTLLATVAMGTAAFELFALAVLPRWRRGEGA